jgi:hypothetical protein
MKKRKFTVAAPDAYVARQHEQLICGQLAELKERITIVYPELAEKQVYKL